MFENAPVPKYQGYARFSGRRMTVGEVWKGMFEMETRAQITALFQLFPSGCQDLRSDWGITTLEDSPKGCQKYYAYRQKLAKSRQEKEEARIAKVREERGAKGKAGRPAQGASRNPSGRPPLPAKYRGIPGAEQMWAEGRLPP